MFINLPTRIWYFNTRIVYHSLADDKCHYLNFRLHRCIADAPRDSFDPHVQTALKFASQKRRENRIYELKISMTRSESENVPG